ncbi:DNA cytosine methyltransferase [Bosea thiooxidans]
MKVLDLFSAAAGGWSLGMHRAGYCTIAACEVIDWRRALYSQNNPGVPVYDDVTTLTADRLVRDGVGLPDIIVGSPPCQDISSANTKGKGVDGERSGLYFEAVRLIDECRPRWFALENSANLRTRGADRVIDALAAIGYTCWPFVVSAGDVGANHERKRSWLLGFCLGDAEEIGWRERRAWGRSEPVARIPVKACGHAARNTAYANETGQKAGLLESSLRSAQEPDDGCCDVGGDDVADTNREGQSDGAEHGKMVGCESAGSAPAEPWTEWNGGLTHHLRVDDGLSGWVAQSRIAVGGPRGTVAASLIVEAFGDAVLPQIPEAIGRAIWRVESALAALHTPAANDNAPAKEAA